MSRFTRQLTPGEARRIRLHLALIPLYVWLVFTWSGHAYSVSTSGRFDREGLIKGHDFVHFYVLGQIALERKASELYSHSHQAVRTQRLAGPDTRYVPVYGPHVALIFAPFAWLSYDVAWILWTLVSAALYFLSCWTLWRSEPVLRRYRWSALVAAVAFPPFSMLIGFGHISSLALAAFTAAYLALRAERRWLAGFALGFVFLKPPLGLILPFVLLYGREWRMITGAMVAIAVQLLVAGAYWGPDVLWEYAGVVGQLGSLARDLEPQPHQMQSLRSFFTVLLPWPRVALIAYALTSAVVVVVVARIWRQTTSLRVRYALLLLGAVLIDPHVNVYDLVVIVPVFVVVAAWIVDRGHFGWGLGVVAYAAYYLPILAHWLSMSTHVQITVLALLALVWQLARAGEGTPRIGG